jgi:hypothetical protein
LAVAGAAGLSTPRFGDWEAFVRGAEELVRSGSYPDRTNELFFQAPGYSFFLAAATLGHPSSIVLDKVASAAAGSLAAPLLAALSLGLFGRRGIARWTGIAGALHPPFVLLSCDVQSEAVFLPLLLSSGALLLAGADRRSPRLALLAGIALAAAALTRPAALALSPLLLAPLWDRRFPLRDRRRTAFAAILGLLCALAPWTIRNAVRFRELIPISDELGCTFFDGNSVWANRIYELTDRRDIAPMNLAMHRDRVARLEALGMAAGTPAFASPSRRSFALLRAALEDRRRDPAGTARLYLRKIWHWLRPYPTLSWGLPIVVSASILYTALYAAAAAGMAAAQRRGAVGFCLAALAISMAAHVLILVLWRYRVPFWDPILLLYAVPGAARFLPAEMLA